jgi:hypothetical protein
MWALGYYANADMECWPQLETVATLAGMSESTAHRAKRDLKRRGLLETELRTKSRQGQTSDLYRMVIPGCQNDTLNKDMYMNASSSTKDRKIGTIVLGCQTDTPGQTQGIRGPESVSKPKPKRARRKHARNPKREPEWGDNELTRKSEAKTRQVLADLRRREAANPATPQPEPEPSHAPSKLEQLKAMVAQRLADGHEPGKPGSCVIDETQPASKPLTVAELLATFDREEAA